MRRRLLGGAAATAAALLLVVGGSAEAVDRRAENDVVLHDLQPPGYTEYFKQEGNGKKNYLYTVTRFITAEGVYCVVSTASSESSIAMQCFPPGSVPNGLPVAPQPASR